jgi:hypothetical protein
MLFGGDFMANGHGGARPGAGRKKKPLAEKLLDGNPGKRKPQVLNFGDNLPSGAEVPDYLDDFAAMELEPGIGTIYTNTVKWLERTGCLPLINPDFIAEYAICKTRWLECELLVRTLIMTHNKNGELVPNPAAEMGLKYMKQADIVWGKIWSIVAQNCTTDFGGDNPHDDIMRGLLDMKME